MYVSDLSLSSLSEIKEGDIVRHKHSPDAYIVMQNCGDHLIVARVMTVYNPREWLLVTSPHK